MKRGLIFGLLLFLILGISILVIAQNTWQITEPTGICGGLSGDSSDGSISFVPECIGYSSSKECMSIKNEDGSPICEWESPYAEFMDNTIHVNKGWNLLWGLYYPSQISEGLHPNAVKAIYNMNPITKEYGPYFTIYSLKVINETTNETILFIEKELPTYTSDSDFDVGYLEGYHLSSFTDNLNWVYFNESGNIKYRIFDLKQRNVDVFGENNPNVWIYDPYLNEFLTAGISMISGWNLLGVTPVFFYDYGSTENPDDWDKKSSFVLNDFSGNCDMEKAYFYGGTDPSDVSSIGQWTEIGINEPIQDTNLFRVMIIKVTNDCVLGRDNNQKICEDTDGLIRKTVKGTVTIKDKDGNILNSEEDKCITLEEISQNEGMEFPDNEGNEKILREKYCKYDENGDVSIGTLDFSEINNEACSDGKMTISQK